MSGRKMGLTEARNLRSGNVPWDDHAWPISAADPLPSTTCDVAIVGGGIMGAILAERLSADGHSIVVLDRRIPGFGSTAASTAELMWAMDVPIRELSDVIGEEAAGRRWQRVYKAVRSLADRIDRLEISCDRRERETLYLEGRSLNAEGLQEECALHRRFDLPSTFLAARETERRFAIAPKAAIVSKGGFEVDPVKLTHGLLKLARRRGAQICYPVNVISLREQSDDVAITIEGTSAQVHARRVILASGYERPLLFLPAEFSLLSTFVMATAPGAAPLWRENAMIWEASNPYLYIRVDADGRIIAGGEDEEFEDPVRRDAVIGRKAGKIAASVGALLGSEPLVVDRAWAATFGASPDGLPAIGQAANMERIWLSAGFGGNGIAFAALAGEILCAAFAGTPDPDAECFDPYRFQNAK